MNFHNIQADGSVSRRKTFNFQGKIIHEWRRSEAIRDAVNAISLIALFGTALLGSVFSLR